PAAVYAAGAAFTARDIVQDLLGKAWVVFAIVVGGLISAAYASSVRIAVASATAFLVSEFLDFVVYTPLRERNWPLAVVASNAVGLVCDSRSEEHTSELQSHLNLVCLLLFVKKTLILYIIKC